MLELKAFFDETGHADDPNSKFFGILGCVEQPNTWIELENEWKQILNSNGLPYFHMSEFAHSTGLFKDWKGDEIRRRKLYNDLWQIIQKAEPFVIGSFVKLADYKNHLSTEFQKELIDVYIFCYVQCLAFISSLVSNSSIDTFSICFDDKKEFMVSACKIHKRVVQRYPNFQEKIQSPVFCNMRQTVPLQVADIIAYESYKEFEEQSKGINRRPKRWGLIQLENLIKNDLDGEPFVFGEKYSPIKFYSNIDFLTLSKQYTQKIAEDKIK